jgi:hypothetical protein
VILTSTPSPACAVADSNTGKQLRINAALTLLRISQAPLDRFFFTSLLLIG